ncbi:unnamed protein product [Trifolium pratense]|uniref:Uncharacterized protein n=1 Tax=Trifolium pratense TaxID=57577 RepID=A0ACB0LG98_TRIPR|nr:unnamed protein product [Trifolium pratense]
MDCPGLELSHVASHLQKYKMYLTGGIKNSKMNQFEFQGHNNYAVSTESIDSPSTSLPQLGQYSVTPPDQCDDSDIFFNLTDLFPNLNDDIHNNNYAVSAGSIDSPSTSLPQLGQYSMTPPDQCLRLLSEMASVSSQQQFRYTQPPSKVLHLRKLPWECTEEELIELGKPFGHVVNTKCNVGSNRNQAFIEFADLNQAIAMISYYASLSEPAQVLGKTVYLQYSNRQEIVHNKTAADVAGNVLLVTIEGEDACPISNQH